MSTEGLDQVEAFIFDVFGTVVDWLGPISSELRNDPDLNDPDLGAKNTKSWDVAFTREWRQGFLTTTRRIAEGSSGSLNVDIIHREILDSMLSSAEWSHIAPIFTESKRQHMTLAWHLLSGWPDATQGIYALKKQKIVVALSNGSTRLLIDLAKHADLPWDAIFSTEMFQTFKPDPKAYTDVPKYLSLRPSQCAMVAAHTWDLDAAAKCGFRTIYVRRSTEETDKVQERIKSKAEGGDYDLVVDSLLELAAQLSPANKSSRAHKD